MDVRTSVFEALDNALENGYDPRLQPTEEVAVELTSFDADLEDFEPATLVEHVEAWKASK